MYPKFTGVIRLNEKNDRERISNGGQVLRDDRERNLIEKTYERSLINGI